MANERPTEHLILTGNSFRDPVDNLVEIINREMHEDSDCKLSYIKRIHDVYATDVSIIPSTPAIAVSWEAFEDVVRTIGQTHPVGMDIINHITIYYYHEKIKDEIRKEEIRDALWELSRILRRNSDANGLSARGFEIEDGQIMNRMRNGVPYSGGLINLRFPVSIRTRRGVS